MRKGKATAQPEPVSNEITRYQVLGECLDIYSGIKRSFSQSGAFQQPLRGYEAAFEAVEKKIAILRELLNEARYGKAAMDAAKETNT